MAAERVTFAHQQSLPRLPVPELQTTVARFLRSAEPLLSKDEVANLKAQADLFLSSDGMGAKLQQRLLDRAAEKHDKSWLIDWWNSLMYLAWRLPVVINVSYFYQFKDLPAGPAMRQTARAAALISGCMAFRDLLVSETLTPESARGAKLCMRPYRFMFNSCRVPAPHEDKTVVHPPDNTRVLIIRKNRFFTFDVSPMGQRCTVEEIETCLDHIIDAAGADAAEHPVGVLTSAHRDDLATYYQHVLDAHPVNKTSLREIEECAFAVCLDDVAPTGHNATARNLLHGDGKNRWFDKHLQFIVTANGKAGFIGEHSAMDGMPTASMCNWVLDGIAKGKLAKRGLPTPSRRLPEPTRLTFSLNDQVKRDIKAASLAHAAAAADHDVGTLVYEKYGKDQAKKFKVSPDAYAQMAIQLAYYSMYGQVRPTYEPAHTRRFLCGRTECIRTVSNESKAFVEAMRNPAATPQERVSLLRTAANAHSARSKRCGMGQGVDRHLLGLRLLRKPGERCPLFDNPAFFKTSHWNISTSNLTSEYFANWGWGEVVPDGLGVAYSTQRNAFRFNVVSRNGVGASLFCNALTRALDDMRDAFVGAQGFRSRL